MGCSGAWLSPHGRGGLKISDSCGSGSSLTHRAPHSEVPSEAAVLVMVRLSCCHKRPPHESGEWTSAALFLRGLEADSEGPGRQGCSRRLLSPMPCHPRAAALVHGGQDGAHVPGSRTQGEAERGLMLSARKHPESTNHFPSLPGERAQSHNQPSCRGGWELCSPWQPHAQLTVRYLVAWGSGQCYGSHMDTSVTYLLMIYF